MKRAHTHTHNASHSQSAIVPIFLLVRGTSSRLVIRSLVEPWVSRSTRAPIIICSPACLGSLGNYRFICLQCLIESFHLAGVS